MEAASSLTPMGGAAYRKPSRTWQASCPASWAGAGGGGGAGRRCAGSPRGRTPPAHAPAQSLAVCSQPLTGQRTPAQPGHPTSGQQQREGSRWRSEPSAPRQEHAALSSEPLSPSPASLWLTHARPERDGGDHGGHLRAPRCPHPRAAGRVAGTQHGTQPQPPRGPATPPSPSASSES